MKIVNETIDFHSRFRVDFVDVTDKVKEIVAKHQLANGLVTVYSQHTSCSVFIQEDSEGETYNGISLILQDTVNCLEKIVPDCKYEGQYLHPGRYHTQQAAKLRGELNAWCLNTDGHIRSSIMGRSESIPLVAGEMVLGEFGRIYFGDFDQTRERDRKVHVHIMAE